MATPSDKPEPRNNPLLDEVFDLDGDYNVARKPAEERAVPEFVARHLRAAEEKRASAAEELPPPARWPMVSGVWLFPFYTQSLETLVFASLGLLVSGWLLMFWIAYGPIGGMTTIYYIGMPTCAAMMLTFGYIATCCLTVIESTATGWDAVEISVGLEWKEWVWNFAHIIALAFQAALAGYAVQLLCFTDSWLPMLVVTWIAFPIVLLSALAADGAWAPLAFPSVLRSMVRAGHAWVLFYVETTPLVVAWFMMVGKGISSYSPWLTPLYAAPFLAVIILIYARLLGRLAGLLSLSTNTDQEGDDDDS